MWIRSSRCLSSPSSWRKIVESQRGTPGSLAIVFRRRSAAGGSARPAPHGDSVGPPSGWSGAKSGSSDRHRQLPTGTKRCSSRRPTAAIGANRRGHGRTPDCRRIVPSGRVSMETASRGGKRVGARKAANPVTRRLAAVTEDNRTSRD